MLHISESHNSKCADELMEMAEPVACCTGNNWFRRCFCSRPGPEATYGGDISLRGVSASGGLSNERLRVAMEPPAAISRGNSRHISGGIGGKA
jgi:hypothetical protein